MLGKLRGVVRVNVQHVVMLSLERFTHPAMLVLLGSKMRNEQGNHY